MAYEIKVLINEFGDIINVSLIPGSGKYSILRLSGNRINNNWTLNPDEIWDMDNGMRTNHSSWLSSLFITGDDSVQERFGRTSTH